MEQILIIATIIAPIVLALVEAVKKTVNVKNNYLPIIAVVAGVILGLASTTFIEGASWDQLVWAGFLSGLSSVGLFELFSNSEGTTKDE